MAQKGALPTLLQEKYMAETVQVELQHLRYTKMENWIIQPQAHIGWQPAIQLELLMWEVIN